MDKLLTKEETYLCLSKQEVEDLKQELVEGKRNVLVYDVKYKKGSKKVAPHYIVKVKTEHDFIDNYVLLED